MATQSCPRCHSKRIRRGYRPTPWWSKIIFRYHLLCNGCNWAFTGFGIPGTVPSNTPGKSRKKETENLNPIRTDTMPRGEGQSRQRVKVRKKIKFTDW